MRIARYAQREAPESIQIDRKPENRLIAKENKYMYNIHVLSVM